MVAKALTCGVKNPRCGKRCRAQTDGKAYRTGLKRRRGSDYRPRPNAWTIWRQGVVLPGKCVIGEPEHLNQPEPKPEPARPCLSLNLPEPVMARA